MILASQLLRRSNSWKEFKNHLNRVTKKEKGDCFEFFTKCFFQIHPTYSTKLKKVWLRREVPLHVQKQLRLPSLDEGIDLIAQTKEDGFWAIQCKYFSDESKSLTRGTLGTFTSLSFNACKNIELALVCTTADRFSYKLKLYEDKLSLCCGDVWRSLDAEFFLRLHAHLDGKTIRPNRRHPRPHQQGAVKHADEHFIENGNARGKMIMPCGTGKSLAAYWIARKLDAKRILLAVPSLALVRQTLEVWATESQAEGWEVNWICVCSDTSVKEIDRDSPLVFTHDLGIRVHTDPKEIASWLKKNSGSVTLVLTTYQSGKALAEASRKANFKFDLGIMDEAHKTVGKKDSLFSHLLHDKNVAIEKRIFMTATERRYAGESEHIASMEDPELYGSTFEMLSFKKALETQPPILSDYMIVPFSVTKSEVSQLIEANVFVKPKQPYWEHAVEAETLATIVALRKAMQKYHIRHAVSFHSSVARARDFKDANDIFCHAFPEYGYLETFHVSGKTPTSVRSRELDAFAASDMAMVTNARCLTEGIDIPDIDCVVFADPKKSTVDIVQAIGRALRPSDTKGKGYVVVPLVVDEGTTTEDFKKSTAYEAVLRVLRALAANDERIIEYFRDVSRGVDRKDRKNIFEFNVPFALDIDPDGFVEAIEPLFWSRLAKLAWRPFEEARTFARKLEIRGQKDWRKYAKGGFPEKGQRPDDIPSNPEAIYKNKGWQGWGDWLGTGSVAPRNMVFRPFDDARAFARRLGLTSQNDWNRYCKGELPEKGRRPEDIPADPTGTYKTKGWQGWGDWLGTGNVAVHKRGFRPFEEARNFVRKLGLQSREDWKTYCSGGYPNEPMLPKDIPVDPPKPYKGKGWKGWGDWLGTGSVAPKNMQFRPFEEARKFVRGLGLRGNEDWHKYCNGGFPEKGQRPDDIPSKPQVTYANKGWKGWGDWLGRVLKKES
jgi:superfamily II DNA or RNA helicase